VIEGLPKGMLQLWLRDGDSLPVRLEYTDGKTRVQGRIGQPEWTPAWPASKWKSSAGEGDQVVTVARAHFAAISQGHPHDADGQGRSFGPVTGERRVVRPRRQRPVGDH